MWPLRAILAGVTGPIFTNNYLLASPQERERLDKQVEYRLAGSIFAGVSVLFAMITLGVLTTWKWWFY